MKPRGGHSVIVVPVPELEPFVRSRWEHYDPSLVSTDPAFTHAHITLLAPYLADPSEADLRTAGAVLAQAPTFGFELTEVAVFPDGIIHLRPDPAAPFAALTAALWDAFPQCPPYGGRYDVAPHLTLDLAATEVTAASTRRLLGDLLPVRCTAERAELHWYETGNCHVRTGWALGAADLTGLAPPRSGR